MSRAENYIKDNTRYCSNAYWDKNGGDSYFPWLTPDQAREAVEIAREEMIEKAYAAYCKTCKLNSNCNHRECYYLNNFKQAMRNEQRKEK